MSSEYTAHAITSALGAAAESRYRSDTVAVCLKDGVDYQPDSMASTAWEVIRAIMQIDR